MTDAKRIVIASETKQSNQNSLTFLITMGFPTGTPLANPLRAIAGKMQQEIAYKGQLPLVVRKSALLNLDYFGLRPRNDNAFTVVAND